MLVAAHHADCCRFDIAYGVSGGSVLAMYYALHGGRRSRFESRFLKQNFQRLILKNAFVCQYVLFSSPELAGAICCGRSLKTPCSGILLSVICAGAKVRLPLSVQPTWHRDSGWIGTQENFDRLCLNLLICGAARAVASSSAVPMLFAPLTLNNNSGNCGYTLPCYIRFAINQGEKAR